jgi:hypothetical protein
MALEILGDDFNVFLDTASNYSTPTWSQQISVGDIGFDPAREQVEIPKRIGVKTYKGGRADWELSFTMNVDKTSTFHNTVRNAISSGNKVHLALGDGTTIGNTTNYWHAWWFLSGQLSASLDDVATFDVTGKCHHDIGTNNTEIPVYVQATA